MAEDAVRGRFVWHELMTTDTKSAAGFFTKLIPWKTQVWGQGGYTMFVANERPVAGLMALSDEAKAMGAPPNWLTYIGTPDVDATTRQAESLGAKVLKAPDDIPTVGRFAVLQDPQGAAFAAFTPAPGSQGGASAQPPLGEYSWHELMTSDGPAAFAFYQKLFGWEATSAMDMGPSMGMYQMFGLGGQAFGGIFKPPQLSGRSTWLPYVRVKDSKQAAETIKKLGGQVINGPMEVPDGDWIVQALDRQGAMFAVHSKKAAAPAKAPVKAPPKAKAKAKAKVAKKAKTKKVKAKPARPAKKAAKRKKAPARRASTRKRSSRRRGR